MKDWPTDPMRQYDRFFAAMCDDWLETGTLSLNGPKAARVAEINRQVSTRDAAGAKNSPATDNERAK